jgi:hypothetical protein
MGRSIGVNTLLSKRYTTIPLAPEWIDVIGLPEVGFKQLIWGKPGQGKTTYTLQLCKELARHGKVYYNSIEQGEGKSLQDVVRLVDFSECSGSVVFGDKDTFDEMVEKLKKNRARFVVIDSLDYINLTTEQYKQLVAFFPKKCIIIITWEGSGGNPKSSYAQSIRYMVDIKTRIHAGVAVSNSRFGATKPHQIFGEQVAKSGEQASLELSNN